MYDENFRFIRNLEVGDFVKLKAWEVPSNELFNLYVVTEKVVPPKNGNYISSHNWTSSTLLNVSNGETCKVTGKDLQGLFYEPTEEERLAVIPFIA